MLITFSQIASPVIFSTLTENKALLKEAYDLSKTSRSKSDQKTFEAEEVSKQIEILKEKK